MIRSLLAVTLALSFGFLGACGKRPDHHRGTTTFSDQKGAPPPREKSPEDGDDDSTVVGPIDNSNGSDKSSSAQTTGDDHKQQESADSNPEYLVPYKLPQPLEEHVNKDKYKKRPKEELNFALEKPHLKISVGKALMTFTAQMKVKGKSDEKIEMSCAFKREVTPWHCDDMFPTDEKIARQRRLQATVNCLEVKYICPQTESLECYRCSKVGFDFITVVDGKKQLQHFEAKPVEVFKASSGDIADFMENVKSDPEDQSNKPPFERELPKQDKSNEPEEEQAEQQEAQQTPSTPAPSTPPGAIAAQPEPKALTDREIEDVLKVQNETNVGLQFNSPVATPAPKKDSQFSIPNVQDVVPKKKYEAVRNQAQRSHNDGELWDATHLERKENSGYTIPTTYDKKNVPQRSYGADITIDLITLFSRKALEAFPGSTPLSVNAIAKRKGKALCNSKGECQASHKNGLDADISFPSKTKIGNGWNAVKEPKRLDIPRFLLVTQTAVCAGEDPIIAFFVDQQIKRRVCKYAKSQGYDLRDQSSCVYKALRHMYHEDGHQNHFHIRVRCPGNLSCDNSEVTLPEGTGC